MYPVLFITPFIKVRSYYLLWAFALLIFSFWTRKRAVYKFRMDWNDVTSVIIWIYAAAVIGAFAGSVLWKIPFYITGRVNVGFLMQGGMSSSFGMLSGAIAGAYKLKKTGLSVDDFADAAVIPASVMIAVGRCGCFLEGCCIGRGKILAECPWWGVHFPFDPVNLYRFPSQLSESVFTLIMAVFLYYIEKKTAARRVKAGEKAVIAPIFLIMYGIYRLVFDNLRVPAEEAQAFPFFNQDILIFGMSIIAGVIWLMSYLISLRKK